MAKGLQKHQAHQDKLSLLGKDLARRSGRKCELCAAAGVSLKAVEVTLNPEPSIDNCIFICEACEVQLLKPKQRDNDYLRCLNNTVWNENLVVQATVVALLKQLDTQWASDLNEQVYRFTELEQLVTDITKKLTDH
ncbi:phnA protein [Aliikangiella marina]|uniref:PhnA protein n=1 Tax=Aliikangiella marina TaxID=1712262 RepID=A0A545T975_9GAMM|nr:phnA protein [Aliikangiella marina]TQV73766.1 phnA protein [Aliikangiella marina]